MRAVLIGASLAAGLVVSACGQSEEAAAPAEPAPRKSMARPAALYAGQEQVMRVDAGSVEVSQTPGELLLKADARVPSAGYTGATFLPRINAVRPADGIYEVDVVANKPAGPAAAVVTPMHVEGAWPNYPAETLKGVRFMAKTNDVLAMAPATPPAPAAK